MNNNYTDSEKRLLRVIKIYTDKMPDKVDSFIAIALIARHSNNCDSIAYYLEKNLNRPCDEVLTELSEKIAKEMPAL